MSSPNKKVLICLTSQIYSNQLAREAIDATLAFSAFEQDISVLFSGSGILQLLKHQDPSNIEQKNIGKTLQAFELYGINKVYVDQHDYLALNLSEDDLLLPIELLDKTAVRKLYDKHQFFLDY